MDKDQIYMYNRNEVKVHHEIPDMPEYVVVLDADGYGEWIIARKTDLVKKEDSYEFKRAKERADELRLITQRAQENLDKLKNKLVDDSIRALQSRVKFNVAFGKGGSSGAYAMILVEQLESLIKEKAEDAVKGEGTKSPF